MLFCHIRSSRSAWQLVRLGGRLRRRPGLRCRRRSPRRRRRRSAPGRAGDRSQADVPDRHRRRCRVWSIRSCRRTGRLVAYMLSEPDWNAGRAIYHLWRQDTQGGAPVQLTTGAGDTLGSTRWSPDGTSMVFVPGRPADAAAAGRRSREPRAVSRHRDHRLLAHLVARRQLDLFHRRRRTNRRRARTRAPQGRHLRARRERPAASAVERLGDDRRRDGDHVRIVVGPVVPPLARRFPHRRRTRSHAARGRQAPRRALGDGRRRRQRPRSHAQRHRGDSAGALARQQPDSVPGRDEREARAVLQLERLRDAGGGGTPKPVLPDFPVRDRSGRLVARRLRRSSPSPTWACTARSSRSTSSTRQWKPLTNGDHYIPPTWSVVPQAGQMVFQFDEPARFGDVWTLAIPATRTAAAAAPVRVTGAFDALERTFALPRQEKVAWKSADGTTIEGVLFYPDRLRRRAALSRWSCRCTAGPATRTSSARAPGLLLNYFPVLTGHGYAVLRPNYRGSTGYGNAFCGTSSAATSGTCTSTSWPAWTHLIKRGIADPDRLVAMGWSAGGHLTNKLVTTTTRFKAASAGSRGGRLDVDVRADRRAFATGRSGSAARRGRRTRRSRCSGTIRRSRTPPT